MRSSTRNGFNLLWVYPRKIANKECVNLKMMNVATIRDSYPLLIIEHVLERMVGKEAYSFLDDFLGYN